MSLGATRGNRPDLRSSRQAASNRRPTSTSAHARRGSRLRVVPTSPMVAALQRSPSRRRRSARKCTGSHLASPCLVPKAGWLEPSDRCTWIRPPPRASSARATSPTDSAQPAGMTTSTLASSCARSSGNMEVSACSYSACEKRTASESSTADTGSRSTKVGRLDDGECAGGEEGSLYSPPS